MADRRQLRLLLRHAVIVSRIRLLVGLLIAVVGPALVSLSISDETPRVFTPFGLFFLMVVLAALVGRLIPGLVAVAMSFLFAWYVYLPPHDEFSLRFESDRWVLALLVGTGIVMAIVVSLTLARADVETGSRVGVELELLGERSATRTFQLALLPERIRVVDGITAASAYVAGGDDVPVGGDWYAAVDLDDHRVGLAIGDVTGRGLPAVAAMAEAQFGLRTLAAEGHPPDTVLSLLNRQLCAFREDLLVTAIYGVLDVRARTWSQANAGHVPAIVASANGGVRFLDESPGPPLGVAPTSEYALHTHDATPGDLLVLYTDGLVERRGEDLDLGFRRLAAAVLALAIDHPPNVLCEMLIDHCTVGTPDDDVAVLLACVERPAPSEPIVAPAHPPGSPSSGQRGGASTRSA